MRTRSIFVMQSVRAIMLAFVFCLMLTALTRPVSADGGNGYSNDVSTMEQKFFEHTYPKDTLDQRLSRLEQMVFGEVRTGSDQKRITDLLTALPAQDTTAPATASSAGAGTQSASAPPAQDDSADQDDPGSVPAADKYARVTALETAILGKTFTNEPVRQRLDQMELKAFGKRSTSPDLSARVDALTEYAQSHGNPYIGMPSPIASQMGAGGPPTAPPIQSASTGGSFGGGMAGAHNAPAANAPMQDRVAWLEQQVFGGKFVQKHLLERLKNLDDHVFPNEPIDERESLDERVNSLIAAVQMGHQPRPGAQVPPTLAYGGGSTPAFNGQRSYPTQQASYPTQSYGGGYGGAQPAAYGGQQYGGQQYGAQPQLAYGGQSQTYGGQWGPQPSYPTGGGGGLTPSYTGGQPQGQPAQQQQQQQQQQPNHHSLAHGLAKALGVVGGMALRSGVGFGGYGMPGMGGFGW